MSRLNSLGMRDAAAHLHPYTNMPAMTQAGGPLVVSGGKGVYVFDENGKAYIEGLAGLWCTSLGFSESRLVAAATAAMQKLPYYHSFAAKVPEVVVELAEELLKLAPMPLKLELAQALFVLRALSLVLAFPKLLQFITVPAQPRNTTFP